MAGTFIQVFASSTTIHLGELLQTYKEKIITQVKIRTKTWRDAQLSNLQENAN